MRHRSKNLWICVPVLSGLCILAAHAQTKPHAHLVVQTGHSAVLSVAFSPDGRTVLTCSENTARLWDSATGKELRILTGHSAQVMSVAFSPDGHRALTGSEDKTARLWDVETGKELERFGGNHEGILSVAFSPDGRVVLTGGNDKAAYLWDTGTGKELQRFAGHSGSVFSVAYSQEGRRVLTGSSDNTARLWDADTGKELRTFKGHSDLVHAVAFSPDGHSVLTGSSDGTVRLWDATSGRVERRFEGPFTAINSVAFSAEGDKVLAAGYDMPSSGSPSGAHLWDVKTGNEVQHFTGCHSSGLYAFICPTYSVAISRDGRRALTGSSDSTVRLWDIETGKELQHFEGNSDEVYSVAVSSSSGGREMATGSNGTASLWDVEIGKEARRFQACISSNTCPISVAISADGRRLLTGGWDALAVIGSNTGSGTARLWDIAAGREAKRLGGNSGVVSVDFSPDGRKVLTGWNDRTVRLLDVETGKELRRFAGCQMTAGPCIFLPVAWSPDGRSLLTGSGGFGKTDQSRIAAKLWDAKNGKELQSFEAKDAGEADFVAFSPDGSRVVTGSGGAAQLWNVATGKELKRFTSPDAIENWNRFSLTSVAISPDNRRVVAGTWDRGVLMWDAETGEEVRRFEGHSEAVDCVVFFPGGHRLLTGSKDGTAKVWDIESGKELATLISFKDGGWAVVDPQGRFDTNRLDGDAPMQWIVDDEPLRPLPLEIFMRDYYTPRLLTRIMNGEAMPAIRSIAEIGNRVQPDISIVSVSASGTHPGRADVVVHAASHINERRQESGLTDLRLFRNGQSVGYREGPLKDGDFAFTDIQLPASGKSVSFTAYAFNSERIKSTTAQKDYAYEPGTAAKASAYLLQIGVNHYRASGCELHGSATDARELSRLLTERLTKRGLNVKPVRLVSSDTDSGATKQEIRDALQSIAVAAAPGDVVFLSFSGHGYDDKNGQFYIFPADIQGSCAGVDDTMLKSAISADELTEWLRPIDAGEMTFVLDSCQSASSVEANDFRPGPMGSRGLGQLAYDKRMRILAASQSNQAAQESESLHQGLLSYALTQEGLVEGMADWKPADQKITVGEWLSYAADAVPRFREAGAVKTGRGVIPVGAPTRLVKSAQIPAIFDFSKNDTFVLQ